MEHFPDEIRILDTQSVLPLDPGDEFEDVDRVEIQIAARQRRVIGNGRGIEILELQVSDEERFQLEAKSSAGYSRSCVRGCHQDEAYNTMPEEPATIGGSFMAITRMTLLTLAAALGIALLAVPPFTPPALADEPSMTIKEGVLDEIDLKVLQLPKDVGLLIRKFTSDRADLGTAEKGDNPKRVEAAQMMQREAPRMFGETLIQTLTLGGAFKFTKESEESASDDALVVEGRFTMINPGSRAKRYWGGFGAGKSGIAVEGAVKNSKGEVLATFKHMRHSGFGLGGGDYVKFLSDDTKDVARDIAVFLKRWATGGDLHKEAD